ncbi:MAG TPA: class I SAM-dependent methyltransferase [Gemmatales bacterium]|nr:class I SAM-dependent methyltransferase [Gemmatales bacterium]
MPTVKEILKNNHWPDAYKRLFDLGCGNGAVADQLVKEGYHVIGVDPSEIGIELAKKAYPSIRLELGSAYDDLVGKYGQFPLVLSLEVVEHVYSPRLYAKCVFDLLEPGGIAVISTPYHSYLKNLVLAVTGKMDAHFGPLWDHGHIKFWSIRSLSMLLEEVGLVVERVDRVGRIPILAKSMIFTARRPK